MAVIEIIIVRHVTFPIPACSSSHRFPSILLLTVIFPIDLLLIVLLPTVPPLVQTVPLLPGV
jgi:hypothetical protein